MNSVLWPLGAENVHPCYCPLGLVLYIQPVCGDAVSFLNRFPNERETEMSLHSFSPELVWRKLLWATRTGRHRRLSSGQFIALSAVGVGWFGLKMSINLADLLFPLTKMFFTSCRLFSNITSSETPSATALLTCCTHHPALFVFTAFYVTFVH